jgi:saccharopine dehydrogenase-like NADP-dependent oxidoreductase
MKKVIIIGAAGSLAQYVIASLKELENVSLTLFLRDKSKLSKSTIENCKLIEGDAMIYSDVKSAVIGQDIVYINLAGNLETMAKNIVKAMKEAGVRRVIAISSIGIYETPLRSVLVPYRMKLTMPLRIKANPKLGELFQEKVLHLSFLPL